MILRWQYESFRNMLRVLFANRPIEMSFVVIGALLVIAYNAADYYSSLVDAGPMVRGQWLHVALAGLAASALSGAATGFGLGRWAARRARALWIAVLPWPDLAKRRSARLAALTLSAACAAIPALCGWFVTDAVGEPNVFISGFLTGFAFVVPAAAAAEIGSRNAHHLDEPSDTAPKTMRQPWMKSLAIRLDRSSPRWVGLWEQDENSPYVPAWWVGSLVVLGGAADAITIAQWQPWPSIGMAVVGGNLAFMVTINGQPLLSPVLRSTSVAYGAVWMALVRVPATLSLAWFAAAAIPAIVVSPHSGGECAGAIPILALLDVLFCASVALNPSSRLRAAILYVILLSVIIYQALQYGVAYGVLAVAVMLGVVALLWSRARTRFRSNG